MWLCVVYHTTHNGHEIWMLKLCPERYECNLCITDSVQCPPRARSEGRRRKGKWQTCKFSKPSVLCIGSFRRQWSWSLPVRIQRIPADFWPILSVPLPNRWLQMLYSTMTYSLLNSLSPGSIWPRKLQRSLESLSNLRILGCSCKPTLLENAFLNHFCCIYLVGIKGKIKSFWAIVLRLTEARCLYIYICR